MTKGGENLTAEEMKLKKKGKERVARKEEPLAYFSKGKFFNPKGLQICGVVNKNRGACQRIGTCPYHGKTEIDSKKEIPSGPPPLPEGVIKVSEDKIPSKKTFRSNWSLIEHLNFLRGINNFGKGKWKSISRLIKNRDSKQVNSHAQKYYQLNPDEDPDCVKKQKKSKKTVKKEGLKQSKKTPKSPSKNKNIKSLNCITISSLKDDKKVQRIAEIHGIKDDNHLLYVFPYASKKDKLEAEKRAELRRTVKASKKNKKASISSPVKKKINIKAEADIPMKFEIKHPPSQKNNLGKDYSPISPSKSHHSKPSPRIFSDDTLSSGRNTDFGNSSVLFDDLEVLFPFPQDIPSLNSIVSISESVNLPPFEEYSSKLEESSGFEGMTYNTCNWTPEDEIDVFGRFERRISFDAHENGIRLSDLRNDEFDEESSRCGSILGKRKRERKSGEFIEEPADKKRKVNSLPPSFRGVFTSSIVEETMVNSFHDCF